MTDSVQGKVEPQRGRTRLRGLVGLLTALAVLAGGVYGWRGWTAYQDTKLRQMALPDLETLAKKQPADSAVQYKLGLAYARDSRYPEATRAFLAALEQEKTSTARTADILNDLGIAYLLQERYYESLVSLRQATELRPDFAAAYANMGRLHLATKMPFTATKYLEKASAMEPKNVSTLCDLGEASQQTLNHKAAETAYQNALKYEPGHIPALLGLGKTYYSEGQFEQATQTLEKALKLAPDSAPARLTLARLRLEQGHSSEDLTQATELLQQAVKTDPNNPDGWYDLGRIALRQSHPTEAIEYLKKAIMLSPQHNGALHQMERALRTANRTSDADRLAKILMERSLREREETRLEEQVQHNPQDWDSKAQLGEIYLLSGKRGLGLLLYEQLKQNAPQHPKLPLLTQMLRPQTAPTSAPPQNAPAPASPGGP